MNSALAADRRLLRPVVEIGPVIFPFLKAYSRIAMDALDCIGDVQEESGLSQEELIESGRKIRGELIEQK